MAELFTPFVGRRAPELALKVVNHFGGLNKALSSSCDNLADPDIAEACKVLRDAKALFEGALAERLCGEVLNRISSDLVDYLRLKIGIESYEKVHIIFLDQAYRYLTDETFHGYERGAIRVSMRAIFNRSMEVGASGLIIAHNHPSGDPSPSPDDVDITRKLKDIAASLDIELVDHVIVTKTSHYSFKRGGH